MIQIEYTDVNGIDRTVKVDAIKLWEARGGGREHPDDGTVIEGYRDGHGVIQLDVADRIGQVHIREVRT